MQSLESECAVLGCVMDYPDALEKVGRLKPEHFSHQIHAEVFAELTRRIDVGLPVDAVTLAPWWKGAPHRVELCETGFYLADLMREAPVPESVSAYADQVIETAERRALAEIGGTLKAQAENQDVVPNDALEAAERELAGLAETGPGQRTTTSASMALEAALRDTKRGIPTGWADMDRKFLGWRDGRLYIAAGRPGMGKSLFGAAAALDVARRGIPVAFVSLEMSAGELAVRLAATLSGIPYSEIERSGVPQGRMDDFRQAREMIESLPFTIIDMPGANVAGIRNALRRLDRDMQRRTNRGLGFVCVDYLGLMSPPDPRMSIYEGVTKNSQQLKQLARQLKVPILVLAQLNRSVEQRTDKHPMLSDLRDSGSIEQDADTVFGLYREAYYAQQQDIDELDEGELGEYMRKLESMALDVELLKQRGGSTGRVKLYCDPATGIITNMDQRGVA